MAFADQNGKITIDEVAAAEDIKNLEQSKILLTQALDLIAQTESQGTAFRGDTGARIVMYSSELRADLKKQLENIETTIAAIKHTVARYQEIDRELKAQIQSTF